MFCRAITTGLFSLILCGLFSCNAPLRGSTTIVPGDGIGPYRLGLTKRADVLADGHSLAAKSPFDLRLEFQFDETDFLKCISVHQPGWKTSRGIGVGSSLKELLEAYPLEELWLSVEPEPHGGHLYWYPGMVLLVGAYRDAKVNCIYIIPDP